MKLAISYLAIPILLSVGVCIYSIMKNESDLSSLLSLFLYGASFYAAPFLVWAFVHYTVKPSLLVVHAGYIGATLTLVYIASMWLLPPDPSGLPIQWMAYLPLAPVFMTVTVSFAYFFNKMEEFLTNVCSGSQGRSYYQNSGENRKSFLFKFLLWKSLCPKKQAL